MSAIPDSLAAPRASWAAVGPALLAGGLSGALAVVFAVSFSALVFSGPLSGSLVLGIAMALWGAVVHALVIGLLSSHRAVVGGVSSEIAIVAVVVAGVAADPELASDPPTLLATVMVTVVLAAGLTGLACLSLGYARAGNLVRYIPYPAVGGFVAGVGWLLLVRAALETLVKRDVILDRELRAAGWPNLLAGRGGGFPGYHYIGCTSLSHRIGANSRLVAVLAAAVCAVMLVLGADLLGLLPRMVAAVLLFFMGLLLHTWLVQSLGRLSRSDYLTVLTVLVFVVVVGFMEGVLVGLILGVALFAFNYSRIDVVKRSLSAHDLRSRAARTSSALRELQRHGDAVAVYRLEGFIFFGTVNRLLQRIRERADAAEEPLHGVILDFRGVRGLDSSAAMYFSRLPGLAQRRGFQLLLSAVPDTQWRLLEGEGVRLDRRRRASAGGTAEGAAHVDHGAGELPCTRVQHPRHRAGMGRRQVAGPCRIRRRQCHGARTRGHAVIAVHQQRPESALHGPRDAHGVPAWRGVDPPGQSLQALALRALRPDRRDRRGQSG